MSHDHEEVAAFVQSLEAEHVAHVAEVRALRARVAELEKALSSLLPYAESYLKTNPGEDLGYMLEVYVGDAERALRSKPATEGEGK